MLGYIAALLCIIAFILRVTGTGTGVVFAPESLPGQLPGGHADFICGWLGVPRCSGRPISS